MSGIITDWISRRMLSCLSRPSDRYAPFFAPSIDVLRANLQPCDVLLVEGNTRLSAMIKFLTQSTWSHAALFVGEAGGMRIDAPVLIEAEAAAGVIASPLAKYAHFNTRICRPVGLTAAERLDVIAFARARIGRKYDSKQVVDLARYLVPFPRVPVALRRRLLAVGSGDPTRAICSTLIGEAFAAVRYPILPEGVMPGVDSISPYAEREHRHIRQHGLYTPRDFDISPYFRVIKPALMADFDPHALAWPLSVSVPDKDRERPPKARVSKRPESQAGEHRPVH